MEANVFPKPSLMTSIGVGKTIGFLIGLGAFFAAPQLAPDLPERLRWALLFWYMTFGAIIGLFAVFNYHPMIRLSMPWWFRGALMGAWLNFVAVLFAYEPMRVIMQGMFAGSDLLASPYWFALEGAILGAIIAYIAKIFAGEGAALLQNHR